MQRHEEQVRADIVEVGRRLHERAYVASNDGNISVRLSDDRLLTTPKSVSKGFMTPDMRVTTDLEGRKIAGAREPSSELTKNVYRPVLSIVIDPVKRRPNPSRVLSCGTFIFISGTIPVAAGFIFASVSIATFPGFWEK